MANKDERFTFRLEPIDRQRLEAAGFALGLSIAEVVRAVIAGCVDSGRAGSRLCDVCQTPRRAEPLNDALAHAQCDQTIANLESEISA